MKKIQLTVAAIVLCLITNAQVQSKQVGKVHYYVVPFNESLVLRNDSIANAINAYISQHAPRNFPDVLLYVLDSNPDNTITNFEEVLVYYQKHRGEFFEKDILIYDKEHIGISLVLFKNHYTKGMKAIEYAVNNFKKLKKKEKRLSRKKKRDTLTDDDIKSYELSM